jgi:hypothetical protein
VLKSDNLNKMSKKKQFVLRVDPEKYERLEKWAADEFRSINGQIEWIIEKALRDVGRNKTVETKEPE